MMKFERDRLWSAYLDGELSTRDAADFHQGLTPEQQDRVEQERRLEHGLFEQLSLGGECPADVWDRVSAKADALRRPKALQLRGWLRWSGGILAAAAAVLIVFTIDWDRSAGVRGLMALPADVKALAAQSETAGDLKSVQQLLASAGVGLTLAAAPPPQEAGGHKLRLLGAKVKVVDKAPVVEILYDCCGTPAKAVLARRESTVARGLRKTDPTGRAWAVRDVGDFVAAAVGSHDTKLLLDLLG